MNVHSVTAGAYAHMLGNLLGWLDKAKTFADGKGFPVSNFLPTRLAPDMLPLFAQVSASCDIARIAVCKLSGRTFAPYDWSAAMTDVDKLREGVQSAIAFLASVGVDELEGDPARAIELPVRNAQPMHFTADQFVQRWAIPNFHFHVTMAYGLLRHGGVDLGKLDFLGKVA